MKKLDLPESNDGGGHKLVCNRVGPAVENHAAAWCADSVDRTLQVV